jgi:hypothetical protein
MASGFEIVADGVTVTLERKDEDGVCITLARDGQSVSAFEGASLLADPAALAKVIDGVYADMAAAKHQRS